MDAELEAVLDDHFLDGYRTMDVDRLRALRTRCRRLETALSYLRRLAQARIDILTAELDRRAEGADPGGVADLLARLPSALADRPSPTRAAPMPESFAPGPVTGTLADELATMESGGIPETAGMVPHEWLVTTRDRLGDYERRVSGLRQVLFERIDTLGAELGRRYRSGEVDITGVIADG